MRSAAFRSKILPTLVSCVVVFLVWGSLDFSRYQDHFHRDTIQKIQGEQVYISDVQIESAQKDETWIVKKIDAAKVRAYVNVYSFTLPSLREALVRAQSRGVDVQVLLEKTPFQTPTINRETKEYLNENSIPLHESDQNQFIFMHAKYMIFDDEWIIETANWTRASFTKNREFFTHGNDAAIRDDLLQIFAQDFAGGIGTSRDIRILAGPTNARERLISFFTDAQKNIRIYAPSLTDEEMIASLTEVCHNGIIVQVILAYYADETDGPDYDPCLQIRRLKKKTLHAKAIIRDSDKAFVGSFNYTQNALENNREVGIFISGESVSGLKHVFDTDWQTAEVALTKK